MATLQDNLPVLDPKTGVILVASGYLFRCPECDAVGYRPSALERIVSCKRCGSGFPVVEVRHRTSEHDLAPGVPPEAVYIPTETANGESEEQPGKATRRRNRGKS